MYMTLYMTLYMTPPSLYRVVVYYVHVCIGRVSRT